PQRSERHEGHEAGEAEEGMGGSHPVAVRISVRGGPARYTPMLLSHFHYGQGDFLLPARGSAGRRRGCAEAFYFERPAGAVARPHSDDGGDSCRSSTCRCHSSKNTRGTIRGRRIWKSTGTRRWRRCALLIPPSSGCPTGSTRRLRSASIS